MAASVEVRGAARLSSTMRAAEARIEDLDEGVDGTESRVLAAVRPYVPVRTGALLGSLTLSGPGEVSTGIEHAWPVHQGVPGRGQAAQPFAVEGLRAAEPAVVLVLEERLTGILATVRGA